MPRTFRRPICHASLAIALAGLPLVAPHPAIAAPRTPTTATSPYDPANISAQIAKLGDPDPAVRHAAAEELKRRAVVDRPALLAAARGNDPQIAEEADQILRTLPWYTITDDPFVRRLLEPYGRASMPDRIGRLTQINDLPHGQVALLRLLNEEQNEDICWQIEKLLLSRPDPDTFAAARRFDINTARPAALVLAAHAWLTPGPAVEPEFSRLARKMLTRASKWLNARTGAIGSIPTPPPLAPGQRLVIDRPKALALLTRAIEIESNAPTYDDGQLDFAFDELCATAISNGQPNEAARLRRLQFPRIGVSRDEFPEPFFELLALHAEFGPLDGFEGDLQMGDAYLSRPQSLFALGRLYERLGRSMEAESFYQAALSAGPYGLSTGSEPAIKVDPFSFLTNCGWLDLAERTCRTTLEHSGAVPNLDDVNARLRLSALAAERGDDAAAAAEMKLALEEHKTSGGTLNMTRGGQTLDGDAAEHAMQIEAAQHALHAAQAKGDSVAIGKQVDELMRLGPDDPEAVLEVVPELKTRGRAAEAAKLFASAYAPLRAQMDAGDGNPALLNEIAWLCARCDERLAEAVTLSNRAVAIEPDSSAYLDTNAEAHFRVGDAAEAIRLETLALKHHPNDKFMQGQLARFSGKIPKSETRNPNQ